MTATTAQIASASAARRVEQLKGQGKYREAGRLASQHGLMDTYGCHVGMRSTRDFAVSEFHAGYAEGPQDPKARDWNAEINAASDAQDWELHSRLWEERRHAEVDADEAILARKPSTDPKVLADRFARELGCVVGTDADPAFWARQFGMDVAGARDIIQGLKITGRAVERNGLLYRR